MSEKSATVLYTPCTFYSSWLKSHPAATPGAPPRHTAQVPAPAVVDDLQPGRRVQSFDLAHLEAQAEEGVHLVLGSAAGSTLGPSQQAPQALLVLLANGRNGAIGELVVRDGVAPQPPPQANE